MNSFALRNSTIAFLQPMLFTAFISRNSGIKGLSRIWTSNPIKNYSFKLICNLNRNIIISRVIKIYSCIILGLQIWKCAIFLLSKQCSFNCFSLVKTRLFGNNITERNKRFFFPLRIIRPVLTLKVNLLQKDFLHSCFLLLFKVLHFRF